MVFGVLRTPDTITQIITLLHHQIIPNPVISDFLEYCVARLSSQRWVSF